MPNSSIAETQVLAFAPPEPAVCLRDLIEKRPDTHGCPNVEP
jgi:hypothetical protein